MPRSVAAFPSGMRLRFSAALEPEMSPEGVNALVWDVERLRVATDAAGVALWSWNVDTDEILLDQRAHELWGVPFGVQTTFESLSSRIHPEDLDQVRATFKATRTHDGAYEFDFRIIRDEQLHWISARGQGDDIGIVGRVMFGVFLDVTDRKQAEEAREVLAGEMSHRVKNLFAIASALTTIASRSAASTTEMARDLTRRLDALGSAHDLVRPTGGRRLQVAKLNELLFVLLKAYEEDSVSGGRIRIAVPDLDVGEATATTLALVVHELATNSIKYGALSVASGTINLTCADEGPELVLIWRELGGPPVIPPSPHTRGFGSRLIEQAIRGQFGGSLHVSWQTEGVIISLTMNKSRLCK